MLQRTTKMKIDKLNSFIKRNFNGRRKPVQHFIQHFFCMFDEMLDVKLVLCYEFSDLHTFIQHSIQHSNVYSFINSNSK